MSARALHEDEARRSGDDGVLGRMAFLENGGDIRCPLLRQRFLVQRKLLLLEVQYRGSDLEDGLISGLDHVGACVERCLWGKAERLLSTARSKDAHI